MRSVIRPRIVLACGIAASRVRTLRTARTPHEGEGVHFLVLIPVAILAVI
jgi:hypothetical protein